MQRVQEGLRNGLLYQTGGVIRDPLPSERHSRIFAPVHQSAVPGPSASLQWPRQLSRQVSNPKMVTTVAAELSVGNFGDTVMGVAGSSCSGPF